MFTQRFQAWIRRHAERFAGRLADLGVTPNQLTLTGVALAVIAAVLAASGQLLAAGLVLAAGGLFDILDGAVARASGRGSQFGAFFDSTLDRLSESAVFAGVALYFAAHAGGRLGLYATVAALCGSFLVSYAKARAEGLGLEVHSGLFARPERVVLTVVGLLFGGYFLPAAMGALALGTGLTVLQRIVEVWGKTRSPRPAERPARARTLSGSWRRALRGSPDTGAR